MYRRRKQQSLLAEAQSDRTTHAVRVHELSSMAWRFDLSVVLDHLGW
jgi:hypothetical protein